MDLIGPALIALALLTTPPCQEIKEVEKHDSFLVRMNLRQLSLQMDIIDESEDYMKTEGHIWFESQVDLLRGKYYDVKDAPPIIDEMRFPDRETLRPLIAFNRQYKAHLECQQAINGQHRSEDYQAIIQETQDLYLIYDWVFDAKGQYFPLAYRRFCLKKARELMGDKLYYEGRMPPHVPIWRFRSID